MFSLSLKLYLLKLHFSNYFCIPEKTPAQIRSMGPKSKPHQNRHFYCVLISESLVFIIQITRLFVSSMLSCRPVPFEVKHAATEPAGVGQAPSGPEFQVRFPPPATCSGNDCGDGGGGNPALKRLQKSTAQFLVHLLTARELQHRVALCDCQSIPSRCSTCCV